MNIITILAVIGLAVLFILTIIFEVMSSPMAKDDDERGEYLPPLTRRQKSFQFSSKMCFYGILGIIFTILITVLENYLSIN